MEKNMLAILILFVGMTSLLVGCGNNKKDSETDNMDAKVTNEKSTITETRGGGTLYTEGGTVDK